MAAREMRGVAAAPGIVAGKVWQFGLPRIVQGEEALPQSRRGEESQLAARALEAAAVEVDALVARTEAEGRGEEAAILATGAMMARDPQLAASVEEAIVVDGLSAGAAISRAADTYAATLAGLPDPLLASRAEDVRSIGRRAVRLATGGGPGPEAGSGEPAILVAGELGPADVAELETSVAGVALAGGGVAAHAAIVARSLGLPMVVGLGEGILDRPLGEVVVIDGNRGVVLVDPGEAEIQAAQEAAGRRARERDHAIAERGLAPVTRDGRRVTVKGNVSSAAEVRAAVAYGAEGIGLLRTELAFLDAKAWPTEDQHRQALAAVLEPLTGGSATVRLLDFGGDKTPPFLAGTQLRGVQLLLEAPGALGDQLAAILRAGAGAGVDVRILVPMITEPAQLKAVRRALETGLAAMGDDTPTKGVLLGAMVEVPAAATMAPEIAASADFLSVGTNDLTQLQLGVDRSASRRAAANHPAVLRLIDMSVRAARDACIGLSLCGESASDPTVMPLLVGLGVDELSVGASRVGLVRHWVRALDYAQSRSIAEQALRCSSVEEVESLVAPLVGLLEAG
jgi:phosphoenolpyruvate-protein phosphotransferase